MYNLTFDNPYNRDIVKKLDRFRNKQQGYFVPSNIEPEHLTHQYDPITITGGARMTGGFYFNDADLNTPLSSVSVNRGNDWAVWIDNIVRQYMNYLGYKGKDLNMYNYEVLYNTIARFFAGADDPDQAELLKNLGNLDIPDYSHGVIPPLSSIPKGEFTPSGRGRSGGSRSIGGYPPDLFEPRYTFNRNHMTGNRLKGGSDMLHQKFYQPTTFNSGIASYDSDSDVDDLGKVHANRRGKRVMVGGYTTGLAPVTKDSLDRLKDEFKNVKVGIPKKGGKLPHAKGLAPISKDVLEKFKRIKGGKKPKKEKESKPISKLLKIFN